YLRHRHDPSYRSLGASGAVSAVLFASILLQPWMLIFIPIPIPAVLYGIGYVAYSFWMDRNGGDNINHSAHLSGAIYGVLFMLLMEPRVGAVFVQRLLSPSFG
ncbi:MAG: rhomboid family intramembrane serine protease, partial [Lysobacter sp.]